MYNFNWGMMNGAFAGSALGFWLLPLVVWTIFWKGWAIWIAARKGEKIWYGALLVINTMGILEILYIFIFSKMNLGASCGTGSCSKGSLSCCKSEVKCCGDEECKDEPVEKEEKK